MKSKYCWDFSIYEDSYSSLLRYSCPDGMNEENREAWRRYICAKISELMKNETMQTVEFQKIVQQIKEEKSQRERYDAIREKQRIKAAAERKRRTLMICIALNMPSMI